MDPRTRRKRAEEVEKPAEEQKELLNKFIGEIMNTGVEGLLKEYDAEVKAWHPPGFTRKAYEAHPHMNRYKDVVCMDQTRVILRGGGNDYIHANWVKGEPLLNTFICTQGPLESTVNEFWRMIVQERVLHIFMLCEVYELGKKKSEKYWPSKPGESMTCGEYVIHCTELDTADRQIFVTCLKITDKVGNDVMTTRHHQWNTWPDRSVPPSLLAVFRVLRLARQSRGVSVVHCSAGIGRTGCVVAIEMILQKMLTSEPFKISTMIKQLRGMRLGAVQIDIQYVYLAMAICKYCHSMQIMNPEYIPLFNKFSEEYEIVAKKKWAEEEARILAIQAGAEQRKKPSSNRPHRNMPTPPPSNPEKGGAEQQGYRPSAELCDAPIAQENNNHQRKNAGMSKDCMDQAPQPVDHN